MVDVGSLRVGAPGVGEAGEGDGAGWEGDYRREKVGGEGTGCAMIDEQRKVSRTREPSGME